MKKMLLPALLITSLWACNEQKTATPATTETTPAAAADASTANAATTPTVEYAYPVKYKDWAIGDPLNIKTTLEVYKAWDDRKPENLAALFADTVRLRIPEDRHEITIPKDKIAEALGQNRSMYKATSNDILSAVALHDKASGEDWVMITTYNKWIEKNGKRDSVLYHDNWKLTNGKIAFLMSFYKLPTKEFLSKADPAKKP
ncbi:MAG: hypothetical protein RL172_2775 [Bacteroidota bacterium]